jgi:hypothetical protein
MYIGGGVFKNFTETFGAGEVAVFGDVVTVLLEIFVRVALEGVGVEGAGREAEEATRVVQHLWRL